ncbi:PREDICTED: uncharacterized protein LOC109467154 [Branchiostoma belcheri]|uniref:Uncharacterized protein LOC109467154 n=1 Tax=Branchiostoma belcheri TaxID=7741 RepID=A0A6P4XVJ1_BRABE|nr:PREDICTED: uncharacterized protein LOC109467154 [Branchiostoma belcheri]
MASAFPCLLTLLVTFVFLCSAQSVCKPPSDEKCVCNCNPVTTCKNDDALNTELKQLKTTMGQLMQTMSDWRNETASLVVSMEQLLQEKNKTQQLQSESDARGRRIQELEQRNCTKQSPSTSC